MSVLVEQVRAPGAARAEVDALLAGLSSPLPAEHSPREHADLLLSLIEDKRTADFVGSGGRTVRSAAVQALLALGYPYALEVPPEALAASTPSERDSSRSLLSTREGRWGFGLVTLVGVLHLLVGLFLAVSIFKSGELLLGVLAYVAGLTFIPTSLMVLGHNLRIRALKGVGLVWLILSSLIIFGPGLIILSSSAIALIPLLAGGMVFTGALLMHSES